MKQKTDVRLVLTADGLAIRRSDFPQEKPFCVDFTKTKSYHNQLIARACGIKKNNKPTLIDATAGFASDAIVLARSGCKTLLLEQSAIVSALVEDALQRLQAHESLNLTLINCNAINYLKNLTFNHYPDVIYLDPMFSTQGRTALAKKAMQILQSLSINKDDEKLFQISLQRAKKRVVVKRPLKGEKITNKAPDFALKGKMIRFDIYLTNVIK